MGRHIVFMGAGAIGGTSADTSREAARTSL